MYAEYPKIYQSWHDNWAALSTYFKYPEAVRRLIYTTNVIEGFNRQLRKVTKSKTIFLTDDSLLKMLYLAMMDITKKWTSLRQDWIDSPGNLCIIQTRAEPENLALPLVTIHLSYIRFRVYTKLETLSPIHHTVKKL